MSPSKFLVSDVAWLGVISTRFPTCELRSHGGLCLRNKWGRGAPCQLCGEGGGGRHEGSCVSQS
eukprot:4670876-Amphidinium_carterae.1